MSARVVLGALLLLAPACRIDFDPLAGAFDGDGGTDSTNELDNDSGLTPARPTSCSTAINSCGPGTDQDCCASPVVDGTTSTAFLRGYDMSGDGMWTNMSQPATLSAFHLDRYEVTVARFRQFVAAGFGTQAQPPAADAGARTLNAMTNQGGWRAAWNTRLPATTADLTALVQCGGGNSAWTAVPGANENRPIGCITYYVAFAFCVWDGGYLPTQTEYFYAAAGGTEQRAYPWSNPASDLTITCSHANTLGCVGGSQDVGATSPLGDGRWGHADLAGNAWEWVLDRTVGLNFLPLPCDDCAVFQPAEPNPPVDGSGRSGSYQNVVDTVRSQQAIPYPLDSIYDSFGIRCARPMP